MSKNNIGTGTDLNILIEANNSLCLQNKELKQALKKEKQKVIDTLKLSAIEVFWFNLWVNPILVLLPSLCIFALGLYLGISFSNSNLQKSKDVIFTLGSAKIE